MRVAGTRVLITGAAQGLGFAIATAFARAQAHVVLTDLNAERLSEAVAKLTAAGLAACGYQLDVTSAEQVAEVRTRLLAEQYGPQGVRANCICPGGVDTPMTNGVFASDEAQARARERIPIGRYAQARDIADVAIFLLTDDSRYVTGQTLPIEGGATIA
jgi:NAD(P)-dependent dehydrogenase (short-subunit alcohol dehydrogenase family)